MPNIYEYMLVADFESRNVLELHGLCKLDANELFLSLGAVLPTGVP